MAPEKRVLTKPHHRSTQSKQATSRFTEAAITRVHLAAASRQWRNGERRRRKRLIDERRTHKQAAHDTASDNRSEAQVLRHSCAAGKQSSVSGTLPACCTSHYIPALLHSVCSGPRLAPLPQCHCCSRVPCAVMAPHASASAAPGRLARPHQPRRVQPTIAMQYCTDGYIRAICLPGAADRGDLCDGGEAVKTLLGPLRPAYALLFDNPCCWCDTRRPWERPLRTFNFPACVDKIAGQKPAYPHPKRPECCGWECVIPKAAGDAMSGCTAAAAIADAGANGQLRRAARPCQRLHRRWPLPRRRCTPLRAG